MAQKNDLWSTLLLKATKNPRMLASLLGIGDRESYTTQEERDELEAGTNKAIEIVAGATKPFAKGANILAQGYGDLYRGLSGNTDYVSPLEDYIKSGISQEEMGRINDNPYKEILKSGAGMAATLAPFATGGLNTLTYAKNPLVNKLAQYSAKGAFEGGLGGYGYSRDGKEVQDTLTGVGIGTGAELLAGYLADPTFRQLLNENVSQGSKMLGSKLRGYGQDVSYKDLLNGGNVEVSAQSPFSSLLDQADEVDPQIDALRDRAFETLKLPAGAEDQLSAFYTNNKASNSSYLNDIELFQRSSVKSPEMRDYLLALRQSGIVEPSFIDMSLKDYGIDPKRMDDFVQYRGDGNVLTDRTLPPTVLGGDDVVQDTGLRGNTIDKNTKLIREYMNPVGVPEPTTGDMDEQMKQLVERYKNEGIPGKRPVKK